MNIKELLKKQRELCFEEIIRNHPLSDGVYPKLKVIINSAPEPPLSELIPAIDWKKLRDEFYKECTEDFYLTFDEYDIRANKNPNFIFEWFKEKLCTQLPSNDKNE